MEEPGDNGYQTDHTARRKYQLPAMADRRAQNIVMVNSNSGQYTFQACEASMQQHNTH